MAATIREVAEKAGVSVSTVSKVLNGWTTISDATKEKVLAAVRELNYTPNASAVHFARGCTNSVTYLTRLDPGTAYSNPHMFDTMCGAFQGLAKEGYTMMMTDLSDEEHSRESIRAIISRKETDGIIIHGSAISLELADLILNSGMPHLVIGHPDFDSRLCWVDVNHLQSGQFVADYICSKGCKDPVFIGGRKNDRISSEREKGFRTQMLHNHQRMDHNHVFHTDNTWQEAFTITQKLLEEDPLPDAIISEDNTIAVGISRALREKGIRVPEDLQFLTFDIYPYTPIMDPVPTAVHIDVYDLGLQAADMMIRKIRNPKLMIQSFTTLPKIIEPNQE